MQNSCPLLIDNASKMTADTAPPISIVFALSIALKAKSVADAIYAEFISGALQS